MYVASSDAHGLIVGKPRYAILLSKYRNVGLYVLKTSCMCRTSYMQEIGDRNVDMFDVIEHTALTTPLTRVSDVGVALHQDITQTSCTNYSGQSKYMPGRHILENYTVNTRVFEVVLVYFLRKYTVYSRVIHEYQPKLHVIHKKLIHRNGEMMEKSR